MSVFFYYFFKGGLKLTPKITHTDVFLRLSVQSEVHECELSGFSVVSFKQKSLFSDKSEPRFFFYLFTFFKISFIYAISAIWFNFCISFLETLEKVNRRGKKHPCVCLGSWSYLEEDVSQSIRF